MTNQIMTNTDNDLPPKYYSSGKTSMQSLNAVLNENNINSLYDYLGEKDSEDLKALGTESGSYLSIKSNNINGYTLSFVKPDESEPFIKWLAPAGRLTQHIVSKRFKTTDLDLETDAKEIFHKYLSFLGSNFKLSRKSATFKLRKNYKDLTNVEYYEVEYSGDCKFTGETKYFIRFYVKNIKASYVIGTELKEEIFMTEQSQMLVKNRKISTVTISVPYHNLNSMVKPLLSSHKEGLEKVLECKIKVIDKKVIDIVDMMLI